MEPENKPLHGLSARERRDYLFIAQLRRTPQFRELVSRLDRCQSVWKVTDWFMSQPNRGNLSNCSFETARRYISVLWQRMKQTTQNIPRTNLSEFRERAFQAHQQTRTSAVVLNLPEPEPTDFDKAITEELTKADVVRMLQYCFAIQKERVKQLRQLEIASNITFPFGNNHLKVLGNLAMYISRVQATEAVLRSKNAWPNAIDITPQKSELLPDVKAISELDPIDQNLIREALDRTLDLLQEEATVGQYKDRVETDAKGTETPQGPSS